MGPEELDTDSLAHTSRGIQDVFVPNQPGVNAPGILRDCSQSFA